MLKVMAGAEAELKTKDYGQSKDAPKAADVCVDVEI